MTDPLLPQIARGTADAVPRFIQTYGSLVWSIALKYMRDRAAAEDVVQEIFVDLWKSADRFDPARASETTFVATVARRRVIDKLRSRSREPDMQPVQPNLDAAMQEANPGDAAAIKEQAARARHAIEELGQPRSQIILMAISDGKTHREIAAELDMPLGTVKAHIRRGLIDVRQRLNPSGVT